MALDRIPGDANLYIGGLFSLRRKDAVKQANITHVVSALRLPLDDDLFTDFEHFVVEVDDVDDENILEHFPASNAFIRHGLDRGRGVLVHCAMGKSRSATLLIAYLLSTSPTTYTPTTALALIRRARPLAEPNAGFMDQLTLYHSWGCPSDLDTHPEYQRWLFKRTVKESTDCGMAPEIEGVRFEDERSDNTTTTNSDSATTDPSTHPPPPATFRCRKCRAPLATSTHLIPHNPTLSPSSPQPCAHLHITPLSWMRPELEQGKLEGRLDCPNGKCGASVGRYAWQGVQCSCAEWVVPGMTLRRGRVDEVRGKGGGMGRM